VWFAFREIPRALRTRVERRSRGKWARPGFCQTQEETRKTKTTKRICGSISWKFWNKNKPPWSQVDPGCVEGALERPRQELCSNACFGATTSSCADCKTLLQSYCFVHNCMVGNPCPWVFSEHNLECKGALKRPQPYLDGGALNAATVQSFIARASLMHTRMALNGANEHFWLQWAVSGQILARRGAPSAQERGFSGGVRCAAAVLLPAEKAHCVH